MSVLGSYETVRFTKQVRGWDDPRLATINGLRRRGFPPQAINQFCAYVLQLSVIQACVAPVSPTATPRLQHLAYALYDALYLGSDSEIGVSRNIGYVENKKLEFVIRSYLDEVRRLGGRMTVGIGFSIA